MRWRSMILSGPVAVAGNTDQLTCPGRAPPPFPPVAWCAWRAAADGDCGAATAGPAVAVPAIIAKSRPPAQTRPRGRLCGRGILIVADSIRSEHSGRGGRYPGMAVPGKAKFPAVQSFRLSVTTGKVSG